MDTGVSTGAPSKKTPVAEELLSDGDGPPQEGGPQSSAGPVQIPGTVESTEPPSGTSSKQTSEAGMGTPSTAPTINSSEAETPEAKYEVLCRAARDGELGAVQTIIQQGTPADLPESARTSSAGPENKHGMTPLLWASERGHVAVVKFLLQSAARLDARDPFRMTALHWAAARGHKDIVCLLVAAGAKLNVVEQDSMTPLHLAATQGQKDTVVALLNLGADPDVEGKEKWPPILWAAHKGNTEVVEVLCEAHGQTKRHMQQALHLACEMGHVRVVEVLINAGAPVNQPGPDRMSPVHRATLKGHTKVVQTLLANGAKLAAFKKDKHNLNHTPLHWAAAKGNVEICEALLSHGQEINNVDKRNWTALHWAVEKGHVDVAILLMKYGANVNATDKDNRSPLRFAAVQGFTEVLDVLLDNGSHIDAADKTQMTALHWAAKKGRMEIIASLLGAGANPLVRDKDGNRASALAAEGEFHELSAMLLKAENAYAEKHPDFDASAAQQPFSVSTAVAARATSGAGGPANGVSPVPQLVGIPPPSSSPVKPPVRAAVETDGPQPRGCFCFR